LKVDESRIKIDWEHSGWQWFEPEKVLEGSMDHDSVPRLADSLRRVYLGPHGMFASGDFVIGRDDAAGQVFLKILENIKTDTENGARVLATKAVEGLREIIQCFLESSTSGSMSTGQWHCLKVVAYQLMYSARPSMSSAIAAAVLQALHKLGQTAHDGKLDLKIACQTLETSVRQRADTTDKVAAAFEKYVDSISTPSNRNGELNIITLSSSSTILAALMHLLASTNDFISALQLTILESRPQCEGAALASSIVSKLSSIDHKSSSAPRPQLTIDIVPDTHVSLIMRDLMASASDKPALVVLGADRITPLSHVSNKTGSANLAILAKTLAPERTKVIVLSEEDKIAEPHSSILNDYKRLVELDMNHKSYEELTSTLSEKELTGQSPERHSAEEVVAAWPRQAREHLSSFVRTHPNHNGHGEQDARAGSVDVKIDNTYFEYVRREYIDLFISENGVLGRDDILRKSIKRAQLGAEVFEGLYEDD